MHAGRHRSASIAHAPAVLRSLLFLTAAVLVAPLCAAAAEPGAMGLPSVTFGLKGGVAWAQHQGTAPRDLEYTVSSSPRQDAAAGIFMILPVSARLQLQQEVLYVRKGSRQDIGVAIFDVPTVIHVAYDMDYLEIPFLVRYVWTRDRPVDIYSLAGFGFGLKIHDRYQLTGLVDDGIETIPLSADNDMSEVDMFDFFFGYGVGLETTAGGRRLLLEYRFDLSLEALPLPTYADVPFGDETVRVENEPVPLRNQCHLLMVGICF